MDKNSSQYLSQLIKNKLSCHCSAYINIGLHIGLAEQLQIHLHNISEFMCKALTWTRPRPTLQHTPFAIQSFTNRKHCYCPTNSQHNQKALPKSNFREIQWLHGN